MRKYLQSYRGQRKKIDKLDKQEYSALHYAVRHGHLDIIKLLLYENADVSVAGADGAHPIHIAAKYFNPDKHIGAMATPNIAKQRLQMSTSIVNHVLHNTRASSPFHLINENEDDEAELITVLPENNLSNENVISYLLRHGAQINADDMYCQTPLHYAAFKGNIEAMEILMKT